MSNKDHSERGPVRDAKVLAEAAPSVGASDDHALDVEVSEAAAEEVKGGPPCTYPEGPYSMARG